MRCLLTAATLLFPVLAVACDSAAVPPTAPSALPGTLTALAGPPAPGPSPTPVLIPDTSPTFTITRPMAADAALTDDNINTGARFVVDLGTKNVFVIRPLRGVGPALDVSWLDDDTLAVATPHGQFSARLDGAIQSASIPIVATPTTSPETGVLSADGSYSYQRVSDQRGITLLVGTAGATPSFRLTNTYGAQWAPIGNLLAFTGNWCAGFDLFTLEPGSGRYRNLTEGIDGLALEYLWKPDASAIAVFVIPDSGSRAIDLADVRTGAISQLVTMRGYGEMRAVSWNPGGTRLLFSAMRAGRGLCESGEPRPTNIERIS